MGIAPYVAEAIIREHRHSPLLGDVLLMGRQTFLMSPAEAVILMRGNGVEPALPVDANMIDQTTRGSKDQTFIRDEAFFRLLGNDRVRALDHSDYEGAELFHDLNKSIDASAENIADFILDGSTLDNLFNPGIGLQNMTRMLRAGGRLIAVNMASQHNSPYVALTPWWFLDYFSINGFADCRVYVTLHTGRGRLDVFEPIAADPSGRTFTSNRVVGIVVFAEKGANSTWDRLPIQRQYASPEVLSAYAGAATRFSQSVRPHLLASRAGKGVDLFRSAALDYGRTLYVLGRHFRRIDAKGMAGSYLPWVQELLALAKRFNSRRG